MIILSGTSRRIVRPMTSTHVERCLLYNIYAGAIARQITVYMYIDSIVLTSIREIVN